MKKLTTLGVSVLLSLTTGCSLFMPHRQTMSVQVAEPAHAKVWINGAYEGEAPVKAKVVRNRTVGVIVKKDGFQTSQKVVNYHLSPTGILDIAFCWLLVPILGLLSPGAHSLDETKLVFHLSPEGNLTAPTNAPTAPR